MIILAAAVMISLSNTGILNKANDAVDTTNMKQIEHIASLAWSEAYADGARTKIELQAAVDNALKNINTSKYNIQVTDKGVTVTVKTEGPVPGLYVTGTNYTELKTSWEDLVTSGAVHVDDPLANAVKNEYGFYYNEGYYDIDAPERVYVFKEGGSVELYESGELAMTAPEGSVTYSINTIDFSPSGGAVGEVSQDGICITGGDMVLLLDNAVTVYTNIDMNTGVNSSADMLDGDLLLPEGINDLGDFYGDYMGNVAFAQCAKLTGIQLPYTLISISEAAFLNCTSLTHITIPASVQVIAATALQLANIKTADFLGNVPDTAFFCCKTLMSVTISEDARYIGYRSFYDCTALTTIKFNGTMEQWASIEFGSEWNKNVPATEVICSDGTVTL